MPQGKRRSARQSSRSNKRHANDSQIKTPKEQRSTTNRFGAKSAKAAEAEAAVCSNPFDALPDEILTLVVSFGDTLELRSLWFASRRFRTLQITADELLWRPHANATVSPLWKSAKWLSAREVWLTKHHVDRVTLNLLKPEVCSGCQECVPAVLTLTEGRTTPSCILCLKDTCMVRESDADDLFRQLSSAQLAKLPHRIICPRRCIEFDHHNPEFQGHERVFFVKDLRRAVPSECVLTAADIPSYTHKYFKKYSPTDEVERLDVIKSMQIEAQVELSERYGLPVNRHDLPFSDQDELFKHMARRYQVRLLSRIRTDSLHPRKLVRLAIQESLTAQELRLLLEPDNHCCSVELPPFLDDLIVSISRDALQREFVDSLTDFSCFARLFSGKRAQNVDSFFGKAYENDARYYLRSVKDVATEFVYYLISNTPSVSGSNTIEEPSDPLSEAECAFVTLHVCNSSAHGYVMVFTYETLTSLAASELTQKWKNGVTNGTHCSDFLAAVKLYSERLQSQRRRLDECFRTTRRKIEGLLDAEIEESAGQVQMLAQVALKVRAFECSVQCCQILPSSSLTFLDGLLKMASNIVIVTLAEEALDRFSPDTSNCAASLKSDRARRRILKEFGGRQNLGETISNGLLETFEARALSLIEDQQSKEKRIADMAILLSSEEMEEAGMVGVGPLQECDRCGEDHHVHDCLEYDSDDISGGAFWGYA